MTLPVNPAGVVNHNAPVAKGQSATPQAKKDRLPWGQIATTVGVGGLVGAVRHVGIKGERELWNSLKHVNLDEPNGLTNAIDSLPDKLKQQRHIMTLSDQLLDFKAEQIKRIYRQSPEKFRDYIRALSELDLDNTAKHLGKTIGWAALAAGATALIYGGIRALVNRNKESSKKA